ncbi:class I SAM-dependent methyltransferase [Commensalibacter oyaizuii]|uniref:50S ribosomal protein L11 methyltransferase n=1 Tax=Commensalibacter oyaizuii TaxID=3043873 RepID=A0ABT6Q2A3_9PROT|nr:50S ribosomal protein L11 methyltransferase [Commensalibacter sp. TBRC 16381]MDI2091252.1 50S ribosomal protein L11 methyltransferase [Commensalibacter sp. TBRC 16381]
MNNFSAFENVITRFTALTKTDFVPEIQLYQANEITPIWQATESWLTHQNIDPPFWAFAWPGGKALARYILDNPKFVRDKKILDFAAGCGIAAIAAAKCRAGYVEVADIDPLAQNACALNAKANHIILDKNSNDVVGQPCEWDIVFCGDVCYEAPMTQHIWPWLKTCAQKGATVIIADPGRSYLPKKELTPICTYDIPTTTELEDCTIRSTVLYQLKM